MKRTILTLTVFAAAAMLSAQNVETKHLEKATFAGGCFWCIEAPFEKVNGVHSAVSGYTGGKKKNPTYKQVSSGFTDHLESVQVTYDPQKISYQQLLDVFWRQFDPTDAGGSFHDRGHHYTSAIFYHDEEQREMPKHPRKRWQRQNGLTNPLSRPFVLQLHSILPRNITRITTRKTRRIIRDTVKVRGEIVSSKNSGARIR